ncbi:hypothetical protein C8R43DRAFT_846754, partial [Mycena crocata]
AVVDWGRDMTRTSEAILVYVLQADIDLLGTAPDISFTMIAPAVGYLVGAKFFMHRLTGGVGLSGASDLLLAQSVAHLMRSARDPGHSAQKCALLMNGMLVKWERR